ncbi:MAG: NADH-quinone oxidoreductase subunit NuoF [Anaerolineales bacterium]|jgi:NADH-quinone oxidoreductase subunit F
MTEHIVLRHRDIPDIGQLEVYLKHGGFETFTDVVKNKSPQEIIDVVKASGLRGRGGAGFPTGLKWSFLGKAKPRYVAVNADESEPGTFKDREIMEHNPFQFLEGVAICCYAAEANHAYIYMRGEFWDNAARMEEHIQQLYDRGFLGKNLFGAGFDLDFHVHLGAGAYICGEESALLESLEGKLGMPRLRPPFPTVNGLFSAPTVINNVETLTNVPLIVSRGSDWYRSFGTEKSPGTKIFCLSGNIAKPGNYELPLGTPFRELIFEHGGGIPDGKKLKAILPAGASAPILMATDEVLDTKMDYESVPNVGSQLGSASVIIIDDSVDISWVEYKITKFFKHESCGKCTPCREGTYWMLHILERIHEGTATPDDVDLLDSVAQGVQGKCLCALGEFASGAVVAGVERFRSDFDLKVASQ